MNSSIWQVGRKVKMIYLHNFDIGISKKTKGECGKNPKVLVMKSVLKTWV